MEEQRQAPPTQSVSPHNPTPVDTGNVLQGDLYAAITAEDEVPVAAAPQKKHVSIFMSLVVRFMRVTFWMDLARRSNEGAFRIIGIIWTTIMSVLYVSGLSTLFLCLTSFVQLPLKLENFFNSQNIQFDSLEMADYSLSQINIKNLHDNQNLYQIPAVQVHSTFGDFLKNKIQSVDVDKPKINFKMGQKENSLQWLLGLISHFNGTEDKKIDIASLNVSNAILTILGKHLTIPVSFTVTGKYAEDMVTSINFTIDEDFLNVQGTMQISGSGKDRKVEMKITSGYLTLPNSPEEDVKGTANLEITNNEIQTIKTDFTLTYTNSSKNILLSLAKNEKNAFDGDFTFTQKNSSSESATTLNDLTLGLKDVKINDQGQIVAQGPLTLNVRHLVQNSLTLSGLEAELNGTLTCTLSEGQCQYKLAQAAQVQLASLGVEYQDQKVVLNSNQSFQIQPKDEKTFTIQFKSPEIQSSFVINGLNSQGYYNDELNALTLILNKIEIGGIFSQKQGETQLALSISGGNLTTPNLSFKDMTLTSQNIFDETSRVDFSASSVMSTSRLIKKPAKIQIASLNKQSYLKAQIEDTDIVIEAKGILQPFKGTFSGNLISSVIQLEDLPFTPNELSDLFPENLTNLSGKVRLRAEPLNYAGDSYALGKIFVGIKDLSFMFGKTQISNLNTMMALKSLAPVITAPNQHVFIESISEMVDLTNISSTFQIDAKTLRLFNITANLANQPLNLTSATIALQNPSTSLTLKSDDNLNLTQLSPYMDLQDITIMSGVGSLSVPVEFSEKELIIPDVLLKLFEVELESNQIPNPIIDVFPPDSQGYLVRNGKMILSPNNKLQVEFDGWVLPQRQKKGFSRTNINLPNPLFIKGDIQTIPTIISDRLNVLFQDN